MHMRRQVLQLTIEKLPDKDLEDNNKTDLVFCTTVDPSTMKKGGVTQIYADAYPSNQAEEINTSTACM